MDEELTRLQDASKIRATDALFANILHCKDIKEFFIQKAIGWALRQYTRTNPEAVFELLDSYEFSNLVKKEAMKWLMRKGLK